jgi:hypothetical protein
MSRYKWGLVAVGLTLVGFFARVLTAQDPGVPGLPGRGEAQPVRVVPVFVVEAGSPAIIDVELENTSDQVVRYLADQGTAYRLNLILTKDGEALVPRRPSRLIALSKEAVRDLKPGDCVLHRLKLQELYPDLRPGLYKLDAELHSELRDFGLTPIRLRQRVLNLRVEARQMPTGPGSTTRPVSR